MRGSFKSRRYAIWGDSKGHRADIILWYVLTACIESTESYFGRLQDSEEGTELVNYSAVIALLGKKRASVK